METFSREELNKIKLFQSVDLESIQGILDACTFRSLTAGEVLITAGEQNRTVYFLLEGHVRVHLASLQSEPTATLGPGESVEAFKPRPEEYRFCLSVLQPLSAHDGEGESALPIEGRCLGH